VLVSKALISRKLSVTVGTRVEIFLAFVLKRDVADDVIDHRVELDLEPFTKCRSISHFPGHVQNRK